MSVQLSKADYRALVQKPKRNKYGNRKTILDGITFHSDAEAKYYAMLKRREAAGEVSDVVLQPKFKLYCGNEPILIRSGRYQNGRHAVATFDFAYFCGERYVVEDVKGGKATQTEAYKLRKAIVEAMYPSVRIVEVLA